MAEIVLHIGNSEDPKGYKDGDILCAFNNNRIAREHAQLICHPNKVPLSSEGLNIIGSLPYKMLQTFYQYHFIRVSEKEVKRVDKRGNFEVFSDKTEKQIYLDEYLKKRKKHKNHRIFGTEGKEEWFGGNTDFSSENIDRLWKHITGKTGFIKEAFSLWPLSETETKHFLPLGLIEDITDDDCCNAVCSSDTKKRKNKILWQDIKSLSGDSIGSIMNREISIDKRIEYPINFSNMLMEK